MKLEDIRTISAVRGILADGLVTVFSVRWYGSETRELTYRISSGKFANQLLYHCDESRLDIVEVGRPWSVDGDRFVGRFRKGSGLCGRERGSRAPCGGTHLQAGPDRQDRGRSQGPSHQGDQIQRRQGRISKRDIKQNRD